ncbi:MAG: hypothetical protein JWO87_125 [Phycisphaerales bacterium]|nr:hypothetical protein [Phycisphaerales bacterium]
MDSGFIGNVCGVEYRIRIIDLPHYVNGEFTECFVDGGDREIVITNPHDPERLVLLVLGAVDAARQPPSPEVTDK